MGKDEVRDEFDMENLMLDNINSDMQPIERSTVKEKNKQRRISGTEHPRKDKPLRQSTVVKKHSKSGSGTFDKKMSTSSKQSYSENAQGRDLGD